MFAQRHRIEMSLKKLLSKTFGDRRDYLKRLNKGEEDLKKKGREGGLLTVETGKLLPYERMNDNDSSPMPTPFTNAEDEELNGLLTEIVEKTSTIQAKISRSLEASAACSKRLSDLKDIVLHYIK